MKIKTLNNLYAKQNKTVLSIPEWNNINFTISNHVAMICSKPATIEIMNEWGSERIPFLFIIDYEMKAIQLYRLDIPLPENVIFSFHEESLQINQKERSRKIIFRKNPLPFEVYERAFTKIFQKINKGYSYLANLTFPTKLETNLTLRSIYDLSCAPYKLLVDGQFICFSPETFVTIRDGIITTRPMKGTISASVPMAEKVLLESVKETAEHHTVVDLLRNDLSMVASEVAVKRFRYIDEIKSHEGAILQVSSEITGKLSDDFNKKLGNVLFALLPAGSVTGAPKKTTVNIIREAELIDRGYYTGVCGIFDGQDLDSAVMIRFIEVCNGKMRFRSGGGITFMSKARDEYNELIQKVYVPIN